MGYTFLSVFEPESNVWSVASPPNAVKNDSYTPTMSILYAYLLREPIDPRSTQKLVI